MGTIADSQDEVTPKAQSNQVDALRPESVKELRKRLQWPIRRLSIKLITETIVTGRSPERLGAAEYELEKAIIRIARNIYKENQK